MLTGVAALDAEDRYGWREHVMGRTATRAQEARARARQARLALLVERNAQDERIEDAVAAVLLGWQDREAAQAEVDRAERAVAASLVLLSREKVPVRDMAALTGIEEPVCARLLKLPVQSQPSAPNGAQDSGPGEGSRVDAAG